MKKTRCITCIMVFSVFSAVQAQQHFFLGAAGGVYMNLPTDINTRMLTVLVNKNYFTNIYTQDSFTAVSPVASLTLGYGSTHFGIQTGVDAFFGVNESILVLDMKNKTVAVINYTYSALNVPLLLAYYFNASKIRVGILGGMYVSFPLGDVQMDFEGKEDFFDKSSVTPSELVPNTSSSSMMAQDMNAGARFGVSVEVPLGKLAMTFDLCYQKEIFSATDSMNIEAAFDPEGRVSVPTEAPMRKLSLMGGPRISVGVKYKFMYGNQPLAVPAASVPVGGNGTRYFMIVRDQVEGPFTREELANLASKNALANDSLIWKKGMSNWEKAETFTELVPLLPATEKPQ